jgi:hypothetical protein
MEASNGRWDTGYGSEGAFVEALVEAFLEAFEVLREPGPTKRAGLAQVTDSLR